MKNMAIILVLFFLFSSMMAFEEPIQVGMSFDFEHYPLMLFFQDTFENRFDDIRIKRAKNYDYSMALLLDGAVDIAFAISPFNYIELLSVGDKRWQIAGMMSIELNDEFYPLVSRDKTQKIQDLTDKNIGFVDEEMGKILPFYFHQLMKKDIYLRKFIKFKDETSLEKAMIKGDISAGFFSRLYSAKENYAEYNVLDDNILKEFRSGFPWTLILVRRDLSSSKKKNISLFLAYIDELCKKAKKEPDKYSERLIRYNLENYNNRNWLYWIKSVKFDLYPDFLLGLQEYVKKMIYCGFIEEVPDLKEFIFFDNDKKGQK